VASHSIARLLDDADITRRSKLPRMASVDSSSIELVGYDEDERELYVRFHNRGRTYAYEDVSQTEFDALVAAPSKGRYLNWEIKPFHRYRRV
jgi:KTSC domain